MDERELLKIEERVNRFEKKHTGALGKQRTISNYALEQEITEEEYTPEELELTEDN